MNLAFIAVALMMGGSAAIAQGTGAPTTNYPPCSRSVTDQCMQTEHGGMAASHGMRATRHHRRHHHR